MSEQATISRPEVAQGPSFEGQVAELAAHTGIPTDAEMAQLDAVGGNITINHGNEYGEGPTTYTGPDGETLDPTTAEAFIGRFDKKNWTLGDDELQNLDVIARAETPHDLPETISDEARRSMIPFRSTPAKAKKAFEDFRDDARMRIAGDEQLKRELKEEHQTNVADLAAERQQIIADKWTTELDRTRQEVREAEGVQEVSDEQVAERVAARMAGSKLQEGSNARAMLEDNIREAERAAVRDEQEAELNRRLEEAVAARREHIDENGGILNLTEINRVDEEQARQEQEEAKKKAFQERVGVVPMEEVRRKVEAENTPSSPKIELDPDLFKQRLHGTSDGEPHVSANVPASVDTGRGYYVTGDNMPSRPADVSIGAWNNATQTERRDMATPWATRNRIQVAEVEAEQADPTIRRFHTGFEDEKHNEDKYLSNTAETVEEAERQNEDFDTRKQAEASIAADITAREKKYKEVTKGMPDSAEASVPDRKRRKLARFLGGAAAVSLLVTGLFGATRGSAPEHTTVAAASAEPGSINTAPTAYTASPKPSATGNTANQGNRGSSTDNSDGGSTFAQPTADTLSLDKKGDTEWMTNKEWLEANNFAANNSGVAWLTNRLLKQQGLTEADAEQLPTGHSYTIDPATKQSVKNRQAKHAR